MRKNKTKLIESEMGGRSRVTLSDLNNLARFVEDTATNFRRVAATLDAEAAKDKNIARVQRHITEAASDLDRRALRMLALWDTTAAAQVRQGKPRDARRDLTSLAELVDAINPQAAEPPEMEHAEDGD